MLLPICLKMCVLTHYFHTIIILFKNFAVKLQKCLYNAKKYFKNYLLNGLPAGFNILATRSIPATKVSISASVL